VAELAQRPARQIIGDGHIIFSMPESTHWIAIVDDDPSVLKALRRSLRVRGFQAKTHGSAREFLASLSDGLPDCLIVDIQMPEMTGLELHLYLTRKGICIPTIVITAHGDPVVRERAESAGVIAILSKPLNSASLFAAIDAATAKYSRNGRWHSGCT
jgi:FixJ family two-component response regulator